MTSQHSYKIASIYGAVIGLFFGIILIVFSRSFEGTIFFDLMLPYLGLGNLLLFLGISTTTAGWITLFVGPLVYALLGVLTSIGFIFLKSRMKNSKRVWLFLIAPIFLMTLLCADNISAYKMEPGMEAHQHITKEALRISSTIPFEIRQNGMNPIDTNTSIFALTGSYNPGDDLITGSAEEDTFPLFKNHYWQPDSPGSGRYNDGLSGFGGSYSIALSTFKAEAIRGYREENKQESFYWLGRVAHLLEDVAQPSHVLLDSHGGPFLGGYSILEEYTGNRTIFQQWQGNNYANQQYRYKRLIPGFQWSDVQPTSSPHKAFPYLFQLFWYTAQKTQYFASDDADRNFIYRDLNNTVRNWDCSGTGNLNLWRNQFTQCTDFTNITQLPAQVSQEANAVVPHAMKAVAALYNLFWDTVHSYEWPTHLQNNRRNAVSILKGDMGSVQQVSIMDIILSPGVPEDHSLRGAIGDLDRDNYREIVYTTENIPRREGFILAIEQNLLRQSFERWRINLGDVSTAVPSIANIDNDPQLEIVFGMAGGRIMRVNVDASGTSATMTQIYQVPLKYSQLYGYDVRGAVGYTAIDDLNHDGIMEIIFTDAHPDDDEWTGSLYVINPTGTLLAQIDLADISGGAWAPPAIANIDNDDNLEIIIPGYYSLEAYDYSPSNLQFRWSNTIARASGAAVVEDVDNDGRYEIVINSQMYGCGPAHICYYRTYFYDAATGVREWRVTHSFEPVATPSIFNVDNDDYLEMVFSTYNVPYTSYGNMRAFDLQSQTTLWTFNNGGNLRPSDISPSIADIDNNGEFNIIFPSNFNQKIYALNQDGNSLFDYTFPGITGSAVALGDVDNDDMLEISLKRQGSLIVSIMSGTNTVPQLFIGNYSPRINENQLANAITLFGITTNDFDNNSVSVHVDWPFNSSNQWISDCHSEGNYSVVIQADDGNLSAWDVANLTVLNTCSEELRVVNITTIPNQLNVTFRVNVTNNLIYPLTNSYVWMDFGDGSNVTCSNNVTLNPGYSTHCQLSHLYGSYGNKTVKVTVDSTYYHAEVNSTFTLQANAPPVLQPLANVTVNETQTAIINVNASDPEQNPLTYYCNDTRFTFVNSSYRWATNYTSAGNYTVRIAVSDGQYNSSGNSFVRVLNVNRVPIIIGPDNLSVFEGSNITFFINTTDPDNDPVNLTVNNSRFVSLGGGNYRFSANYSDAGLYRARFTATDGFLSTTHDLNLTVVNVNRAPIMTGPNNLTIFEGNSTTFFINATDPDNDPIVLAVNDSRFQNLGGGNFRFDANYGDAGVRIARFTANDGSANGTHNMTLTVINVNRAPVIAGPNNGSVNESNSITISLNITDPDNDPLTVNVNNSRFVNIGGYNYRFDANYSDAGIHIARFTATDGVNSTNHTYTLTVINVNRNPVVITTPVIRGGEGYLYTYDVNATDPDSDPITYSLLSPPVGMVVDGNTGIITWRPSSVGNYSVAVQARDSLGGNTDQNYTLTIVSKLAWLASLPVQPAPISAANNTI